MGFFSGVFKAITKPFKAVAKTIKKTASKVWKGIKTGILKPLGQLYAKTFGKLGPLGMIAASFILPGIGSLIAAGWGSAAGALAGSASGFLQAVGAGMNAISAGVSTVGSAFGAVSDKIGQTFTNIGGSISKGASNLFNAASEWTKQNLPGTFDNLSKMGNWVADKAQSFGLGGEPSTIQQTNATIQANPEFLKAVKPRELAGATFKSTEGRAASSLLTEETLAANPEFAKFAKPQETAAKLAESTQGRSVGTTFGVEPSISTGSSLAKKALQAGASLLGGPVTPPPVEFAIPVAPSNFGDFATQRFGITGTGATGGQFLTPEQRAFFQQHAQLLGQQG